MQFALASRGLNQAPAGLFKILPIRLPLEEMWAIHSPWRGVSKLCLTNPDEPARNCTLRPLRADDGQAGSNRITSGLPTIRDLMVMRASAYQSKQGNVSSATRLRADEVALHAEFARDYLLLNID
jgi:hypothetical protein